MMCLFGLGCGVRMHARRQPCSMCRPPSRLCGSRTGSRKAGVLTTWRCRRLGAAVAMASRSCLVSRRRCWPTWVPSCRPQEAAYGAPDRTIFPEL